MRDTLNLPTTRTWRDIPQPVVPRAMSREGRWRLVMATLRVVATVAICVVIGWGAWLVVVSLDANTRAMPAAAKGVPMKPPELHTDGVLDEAWLTQALALPKHASLDELDLARLRARLMTDGQVVNATLTKRFPDRLIVQLTERNPVARVMTRWMGQQRMLLVARDGVLFEGHGYDQALLDTLPWLAGVKIVPAGGRFQPIQGMDVAAELLAKARLETDDLYANWSVISLARLQSDHKIEIQTKDGSVVYFSTTDDFFRQLAKLDYIVAQLARAPNSTAAIDLTLGADVPVTLTPRPAADDTPAAERATPARRAVPARDLTPAAVRPQQTFFTLPHPQPTSHREF